MFKKIFFLLLLTTVVLSCQSDRSSALKFVDYYNKEIGPQFLAGFSRNYNNPIHKTYAELLRSDTSKGLTVKIAFVSKLALADEGNLILKNYLPSILSVGLMKDKSASALLEKGVNYHLVFESRNGRTINEVVIDQKKLHELTKERSGKNLEMGKNNSNKNVKPEVKELLIALNNSLPIVIDEELQIKIIKIDLNSLNDLVYTAEIDEQYVDPEVIKKPETQKLIKSEIVSEPQIITLYQQIGRIGLAHIRYIYVNKKGAKLAEIVITDEDIYTAKKH